MITSKQRAYLRGQANTLSLLTQIGKGGVTPAVIRQVDEMLLAHELVKLSVLETAGITAREACDALSEALQAEPVQVIGNRLVLYRRHPEKPRYIL
jgi:RNA-binding protein